jgi:ribonuclease HI
MHGLELLKKGIVWRIGNGKKVRIWRDNWVPRGDIKITNNVNNSMVSKVEHLINQDDHSWNEGKVRHIFSTYDAEEILKIRLPNYEAEDFISWIPERHGLFTVRSAYNLALDLRNTTPPNSSRNTNGDRPLWKTIWNSNVPPKVKNFTWKLATNSLAVQANRIRRLPNVLPTCTICGREEETWYHATMKCTKAMALRQGLAKSWNLPQEKELGFTGNDWVLVLLDKLDKEMREKMMFIWWRAWHHRNNIIFDKGDASVNNSIRYLQNYLATLQGIAKGGDLANRKGKDKVLQNSEIYRAKETVATETWRKPEEGWVKCNVDASFSSEERTGAWGAVLRDHNGQVIASAWDYISHCNSATVGEAVACLEGLKLALANSSLNLIIETDCAAVLEVFKSDSMDRSESCVIAKEFRLKKPPDRQVVLAKISRVYNAVAHELCQLGRRELSGGVLQNSVPTCVSKAVLDDCNQNFVI